ncbi:DinB family protein [Candidimonas nitroreducens]|uniref:Damage-inducible protein DinB n=1 Tax=Candidimonas nitroreducens TaxID=683354 RepID=A0A225MRX6_9BURK|nr:DinB family protein [Candidimonas nitroreducens]OWT63995.1 damage-inducible protein DinB [Candidimonas nitroreducens]
MMTKETVLMLARYSDWADQVLFKAMAGLPAGAVYKVGPSVFGSMVNTLNHNYQVDMIWRAHLLGVAHGFTSRRDVLHPELADLVKAQSEVNQWYIDWAQAQDAESLAERLKFNFVSGAPAEMPRGGMFLHVVNHKTYHRGWVGQMFFDFGAKPPQTDLSVFLCET